MSAPTLGGLLTSVELMDAGGVTRRQLDHWRTHGILIPAAAVTGVGHGDRWAPPEVTVAVRMRELSDALGCLPRRTDVSRAIAAAIRAGRPWRYHTPTLHLEVLP